MVVWDVFDGEVVVVFYGAAGTMAGLEEFLFVGVVSICWLEVGTWGYCEVIDDLQHAGYHTFVFLALWSMVESTGELDQVGFLLGCGGSHCLECMLGSYLVGARNERI